MLILYTNRKVISLFLNLLIVCSLRTCYCDNQFESEEISYQCFSIGLFAIGVLGYVVWQCFKPTNIADVPREESYESDPEYKELLYLTEKAHLKWTEAVSHDSVLKDEEYKLYTICKKVLTNHILKWYREHPETPINPLLDAVESVITKEEAHDFMVHKAIETTEHIPTSWEYIVHFCEWVTHGWW
jgi:hypothetical protein